ncbi:P-loop containing nucleoside triphosphate hydrolase protein [Chlamydoabsidia padenii]|nr:P-loop containing nucleoside triphosphate hydrolase protein [Chlamydoabsidia padenii]
MDGLPAGTLEAKVVILGRTGVGKTSLAIRYVQKTFSPNISSTIGASFMTKKLIVDECRVRLQIWDTAGQERFRAMTSLYYREAAAAILVYDITSSESFQDLLSWVEELKAKTSKDLLIYIVGNKVDCESDRAVSLDYVQEYVRNTLGVVPVFEVSAKEDEGAIEDLFLQLAQTLVNQKYEQHWKQSCPSLLSEYEDSIARSGCCSG